MKGDVWLKHSKKGLTVFKVNLPVKTKVSYRANNDAAKQKTVMSHNRSISLECRQYFDANLDISIDS